MVVSSPQSRRCVSSGRAEAGGGGILLWAHWNRGHNRCHQLQIWQVSGEATAGWGYRGVAPTGCCWSRRDWMENTHPQTQTPVSHLGQRRGFSRNGKDSVYIRKTLWRIRTGFNQGHWGVWGSVEGVCVLVCVGAGHAKKILSDLIKICTYAKCYTMWQPVLSYTEKRDTNKSLKLRIFSFF